MSAPRVLFDVPGPRARTRHTVFTVVGGLLLAAAVGWLLWYLWDLGQITPNRWEPFLDPANWTQWLLPGLQQTLTAAAIAIVLSTILGIGFALGRMSDIAPLRWVCTVFVEFFRAVPVLIMMFFAFFFMNQPDPFLGFIDVRSLVDSEYRPLVGVVVGLVCYNSAVIAEVIRAGVASLPAGQREAGLSIGLTGPQARRMILVPQALTAMLPTLVSQLVVVLKDTALGYIILYPELLLSVQRLGSRGGNMLAAFVVGALIFILINYLLTKVAERLESRLRRRGRTAGAVGGTEVPGPVGGTEEDPATADAAAAPGGRG